MAGADLTGSALGGLPAGLPTGPRGRALALLLPLLLLVAGWLLVLRPLLDAHAAGAERADGLRALVGRMEALAASRPSLRARAEREAGGGAGAPTLIAGDTDAIAGAALQVRLRELASGTGATLASTESLPAEAVGAYRRIGVRVSVSGTWPVLTALLGALERASPRMLVDDLRIGAGALLVGADERPLDATFTVLAFRAGDPRNPPAAAAFPGRAS